MNITEEQRKTLSEFNVKICDNIKDTLIELDDKILEIGFNSDYSLNKAGLKLQLLYDKLYSQN